MGCGKNKAPTGGGQYDCLMTVRARVQGFELVQDGAWAVVKIKLQLEVVSMIA